MHILVYTHFFEPVIGGVEKFVLLLAGGLAERGYRVTVVTPTPAGSFDDSTLSYEVVRRPGLFTLARLIREADVVQLAGPALTALTLALLARRPVVIEHHGYHAICPNGLLLHESTKTACPGHFMAKHYGECLRCNMVNVSMLAGLRMLVFTVVRRWLCKRADSNVAITEHVAKRLVLPRSCTIRYGLPSVTSSLSPLNSTRSTRPVFAYVGRLVSEKGLSLLVEAAAQLQGEGHTFLLRFIGDGPLRRGLEVQVRERGVEGVIEFAGFLRGEAFTTALEQVTAVVMPSIWEETAGLAAIEHMQIGRLVVAADIGGLGEVVGDAGLKFPPGDVSALVDRLRQVIAYGPEVVALGACAQRRAASHFTLERMLAGYCAEYDKLQRRT